jgi:anti-sigma B factor antagonist
LTSLYMGKYKKAAPEVQIDLPVMEFSMIEVNDKGQGVFTIKIVMQEVHTLDVPDLKEKLQQAIINKGIKKLVLDLTDVKMITSSGIGIFLNINQSLKNQLRLACANAEVKKVLELTKVTSVIKAFNTMGEALSSF